MNGRSFFEMQQFDWPGVTSHELAEAQRHSMCIDWSPQEEVFIVSFPDVPLMRTHGATREEAVERGEAVIVAWLTAMKDADHRVTPPKIRA
jgi:predicted RNase H-like HicB family nuclease